MRPGEAGRAIIDGITARQVIDSRGNPTVEADVHAGLFVGRASVPSGASKGRLEAAELRDGRPDSYHGMGVGQAVQNIRTILLPKLRGVDVTKQNAIDELMIVLDGTPNKGRIGANAILAVSMAAARASAASKGVHLFESIRPRKRYSLPVPMMNVINGGEHAGNELDVQEFVIEPVGAKTCTDAIRMGSEVYHSLKLILRKKYGELATNVGDEGGFAPPIRVTRDALRALSQAVANAGYDEGDVRMGIDAAASTFFNEGRSVYGIDGRELSEAKLEDFYVR
ncbi:MAG TPA: hypothetical protein VEJ36_05955, partial [Nitrososphaerales archaeon]|nr:hypothetical protein [Nitrososphaerales archaeon]